MLDRAADVAEKRKPLLDRQPRAITVLRDRIAADQFHHEVRPPVLRRAGVEDPGDVGVIHHGQGCRSASKRAINLLAVHARLDDLEGDPRTTGSVCSAIHTSPNPLPDLLQELVTADARVGVSKATKGNRLPRVDLARAVQESAGGLVRLRAVPSPVAEAGGRFRSFRKESGPLLGGPENGAEEDLFGPRWISLAVHGTILRSVRRACQETKQPGPGVCPFAVHGAGRNAQGLGGLVNAQVGEEPQAHHLCASGSPLPSAKGLRERHDFLVSVIDQQIGDAGHFRPVERYV